MRSNWATAAGQATVYGLQLLACMSKPDCPKRNWPARRSPPATCPGSRPASAVRARSPRVAVRRLGTTPEQLSSGSDAEAAESMRLGLRYAEFALGTGDAAAALTGFRKATWEGARDGYRASACLGVAGRRYL
jgi:hypothetical protein